MTMPNGDQPVDDQQVDDQHVDDKHVDDSPTWKPPASQEEFDRIIADRLKRETKKYRDYDALKDKATKYDTLSATTQTEHEKAVAEAEENGYGAADLERIQRKVKAIAPKQAPPSFGQGPRGTGPQGSNMNDLLRQMAGVKQH
jgi:hypothetical protein